MTFKDKLACSTLTDNQHDQIIRHIEFLFTICATPDELLDEYKWLCTFIWNLESMSFICPREREKYLVFIQEKYEDYLERIEDEA